MFGIEGWVWVKAVMFWLAANGSIDDGDDGWCICVRTGWGSCGEMVELIEQGDLQASVQVGAQDSN